MDRKMKKSLNCILLIDDNEDDNFFHKRVIMKSGLVSNVVEKKSGEEALEYLKMRADHPEIIFLDINMPGMSGWEFLEEYQKLPKLDQSKIVIVMLTTSTNPDDREKAGKLKKIAKYKTKPLTVPILEGIIKSYFHDVE